MKTFKRENALLAALAFLFVRKAYIRMAVSHGMAINLEARDLATAFKNGTYPEIGWESLAEAAARDFANALQRALAGTLVFSIGAAGFALSILFFYGRISFEFPLAIPKALGGVGTFFAAWATMFELAGIPQTWSGEALHEKIHPMIFCMIFLPGLWLALVGQLW